MSESRVLHPEYGLGDIVTYRRGGRVAIVDFDDEPMPTHVPSREITVQDDGGGEESNGDRAPELFGSAPEFEGSKEASRATRVLEAMRLGVVPASSIDVYTVARDVEVSQIESDLTRARDEGGAVRAILGDYGTGKTHLLELARERAREEGFVTARVVLDPRETPPSHPKRVYRDLVGSLAYPDRPRGGGDGLRPLFDRAIEDEEACEALDVRRGQGDRDERLEEEGMHLYLTPALSYYRELAVDDAADNVSGVSDDAVAGYIDESVSLLMDWIEGQETMANPDLNAHLSNVDGAYPWLYSLMDFRPWARIYGYLLSGIAKLTRLVGYAGLIVLVDEAERYSLLSSENREFAEYVFKAMSFAAVGDEGVPFDRQQLDDLGGWGVQKRLPPRYDDEDGLYTIFAMTPHETGIETLYRAVPAGCVSELTPFDDRDYAELAAKVCDFYASAYPDWSMTEQTVTKVTSLTEDCRDRGHIQNPREAMKFIVELLDIARLRPDEVETAVRAAEHLATF